MRSFYVLKPQGGVRFGTKWAYADQVDPVHMGEGEKCPVCGSPVVGLRWLPPHRIKLSSVKPDKWGDLVWGAGFDLIVSARFKAAYEAEGLSGISVFHPPVEIVRVGRGKTGELPHSLPVYHLIEVVWGGANQDDVASEVVRERPATCSYCRVNGFPRRQQRIAIEEASWTGADIFMPRGAPVRIMVTERFQRVVERHKLKNHWLIPAEKYAYDDHRRGLWYVRENQD
jgi:hypothetical protein